MRGRGRTATKRPVLGQIIWLLLLGQLAWTGFVVGQGILSNSKLSVWLNGRYTAEEKVHLLRGAAYSFAQQNSDLPLDASYLVLAPDIGKLWFYSYYLFPRKLFWNEESTTIQNLAELPMHWLREHRIDYVVISDVGGWRVFRTSDLLDGNR